MLARRFVSVGAALRTIVSRHASSNTASHFSDDQLNHFRDHGFVMGKDFLSAAERHDIVQWAGEMRRWPEAKGKWMLYYEKDPQGNPLLCRVENFLPYHDKARELIRGKIMQAISELMGEPAVLYKEKINFKLPGAKGFPAHQDAPAYVTFGMKYHVTCMIAADAATLENGCLEVVPRAPDMGMLPHPDGQLPREMVEDWEAKKQWQPVICDSGDVVFFDSLIPHRSQDNQSATKSRSIYYLTYNPLRDGDRRDGYYAEKRRLFPPDNEKVPGQDYSEGAAVFNLSTPITEKKEASA